MDSLGNVIFTELIAKKFLSGVWNTFWFCVELLIYPNIQVGVDKFLQWKFIWPDAEDITASRNWNVLHVLSVIWYLFFCFRKTAMLLFDRNKSVIKILLRKGISKPLTICIITQSKCEWQNATNVYYMKRKQTTNMQIFAASGVSRCSYCNSNPNSGS